MNRKVYKFGGASVRDAESVKNVVNVLQKTSCDNCLIVVSAMAKTTNALEEVVELYFAKGDYESKLNEVYRFHTDLCKELFPENHEIFEEVTSLFNDLNSFLNKNKSPNYNYVYDQTVSVGEIASTKIVSAYFNEVGIENTWLDVRNYIKTNNHYRDALVNWKETEQNIAALEEDKTFVTQGFLGSDENFFTTTLGREGSDYTGAIFAYCLNAESLTIWKDVPGVLNADPRYFEQTQLLHHISYEEAIELAYYGASVIHPKTLQPLRKKEIPLWVKSFLNPTEEGTSIKKGQALEPNVPCYILKRNQAVLTVTTKDFSFINEEVMRDIFHVLSDYHLKVNLIQNSAISLKLCIEDKFRNLEKAFADFGTEFEVETVSDCELFTIRHYDENWPDIIPKNVRTVVEQMTEETLQIVTKSKA